MKAETFLKRFAAVLSTAVLVLAMSACASHSATTGQDYGQVRTEAAANDTTSSDQVVGTAPAPANAAGVSSSSTPAAISGPAKVDDSGRAYTSSAVGSAGNGSAVGTNTNVNLIPKSSTSSVTVTQSPATVDTTATTTTTTTPVIVETTPAPTVTTETAVITTPPAAPVVESTTTTTTETTPMTSSSTTTTQESTSTTTTESTSKHRRMRKD